MHARRAHLAHALACTVAVAAGGGCRERTDALQARLKELCVGAEAVEHAVNAIHALSAAGVLPHVALLQRLFRAAVECLAELPHTRWTVLHRVARRFRCGLMCVCGGGVADAGIRAEQAQPKLSLSPTCLCMFCGRSGLLRLVKLS